MPRRHSLTVGLLTFAMGTAALSTATASASATPGSGSTPSAAPGDARESVPPGQPARLLDRVAHGKRALAVLSGTGTLPAAARVNGRSSDSLRRILGADSTAWIGLDGRLFYREQLEGHAEVSNLEPTAIQAPTFVPGSPFALHSRPGSSHTLFVDFDGADVRGTFWNSTYFSSTPMPEKFYGGWSLDADPAFSTSERDTVATVWRQVADAYGPFDVDVTTEDPGDAALRRSTTSDPTYGVRALVTKDPSASGAVCTGCSGAAMLGTFNQVDPTGFDQPAWIFTDRTYNVLQISQTVVHEVGHTFGLAHDGTTGSSYYQGQGVWQPVMGSGLHTLTQFSKGEYDGADNTEDDLALIASHGAPLVADDHGDTLATATPVDPAATWRAAGVISSAGDRDVVAVRITCPTTLQATLNGTGLGQPTDLSLALLDASGTRIAYDDPAPLEDRRTWPFPLSGLDAGLSRTVGVGTWYLRVDGVGYADPRTNGYSDYGSVGAWTLTGTGCAAVPDPPRDLVATHLRDVATLRWIAPTQSDSPVTGYVVRVPGRADQLVTGTSASLTGLAAATDHRIEVLARSSAGDSVPSVTTVSTGTWAPPVAPVLTVARPARDAATLSWTLPDNPGAADLGDWRVEVDGTPRTVPATARSLSLTSLGDGNHTVTLDRLLLTPTTDGSVPVRGAAGFTVAAAPPLVTVPLPPPIGLASSGARGGGVTAVVRWGYPASDGGTRLTAFKVRAEQLNRDNRVVRVLLSRARPPLTRVYSMPLPRGRYRFRVMAFNAAGHSGWSRVSRTVLAR